jgi:hypothetical protein
VGLAESIDRAIRVRAPVETIALARSTAAVGDRAYPPTDPGPDAFAGESKPLPIAGPKIASAPALHATPFLQGAMSATNVPQSADVSRGAFGMYSPASHTDPSWTAVPPSSPSMDRYG